MNRIFAYILLILCNISLYSQVVVEQEVSQVDLLIGEQVELKTTVLVDADKHVTYPSFTDSIYTNGVEVVYESKIDTTLLNAGKRLQLSRTYKLTSFDSAFYALPPFYVLVEKDTFRATSNIGLKVTSVPVDTTNANEFAGPYSVTSVPFQWSYEFWLNILIFVIGICGMILIYKKLKDNKPITKRIVVSPPTPAHKQALEEFEQIKSQKLETEEELKLYYDQITDTLRRYIENRFALNAKELTSEEIILKLTEMNNVEALRELKEILTTADLVKFAKYKATVSEVNRSVVMALDYVNTTRLSDEQLPKPEVKIVTIGATKQRNVRIILFAFMIILTLLSLYLLGYILKEIYECFIA